LGRAKPVKHPFSPQVLDRQHLIDSARFLHKAILKLEFLDFLAVESILLMPEEKTTVLHLVTTGYYNTQSLFGKLVFSVRGG